MPAFPRSWVLTCVALLAGCGEWSGVILHDPASRREAVCVKDRGRLPPRLSERLRECIEACEARGFVLDDPSDKPEKVDGVVPAVRTWVPHECAAASAPG